MSKASALASLTGTPAPAATPAPKVIVEPSGQAPGVVETEKPAEAVTELESTRFAAFAKREQALVQEKEKLKKEREELEAEKNAIKEKLTPFEQFQALKSKDPVSALRNLGFTETDIVNFLADKKEPTPEEIARAAAQEIVDKARKEDSEKAQKAQSDKDEAIKQRFRGDIKEALSKASEKYEYCAYNGPVAEELVYNTIVEVLNDTGEMISIEEGFQMVEDYYENMDKEMQEKVKKRKPKVEEATVEEASEKAPSPAPVKPKTLTNAATPTVAATINRKETRSEKRQRLEEALRNGGFQK